jgi:hypothetical protein
MITNYDLTPHNLVRSPRLLWLLDKKETALASIKSKSTRKFLTRSSQLLEEAGITYSFSPISLMQYQQWLNYYTQKMIENNFEVMATEEWYLEATNEGDTVLGMFFYKQEVMIGSGIIQLNKESSRLKFKASDKVNLSNDDNSSLGAIIDYRYMEEMMKQNVPTITSGRSRNAFGIINKLGYLDYKLKFGFYPIIETADQPTSEFLLNEEGRGVSFCHQPNDTKLTMIQVCPAGANSTIEASRFAGEHFDYQVFTY